MPKLLPPRHCSKIPTPSTPKKRPPLHLSPLCSTKTGETGLTWIDRITWRRQLKTISFRNWTQNEIEILNWNQLKPIIISTYLDISRNDKSSSEELGHAMQPFCDRSLSVPRHLWGSSPAGQEPDPRHLSLARYFTPGVTRGVTRSHQLRVSTHRTEISDRSDPVDLNILNSRSSQAQSDVKWSKYI